MKGFDLSSWMLVACGCLVTTWVFLRGIGQEAVEMAWQVTDQRRKREATTRADNAAAEAAGRAASLEPLALNADGTIEEPILALVESL